jgi:uncharacterized membrane protein YeaQ/YmgE (transglycosylase-associated protein family)
MNLLSFLLLLVIAALAGALGQALAGYSLGGFVISTVVGFAGAFIGTWLARELGLPLFLTINVDGETFPLIWAIIGSALLSAAVGLVTSRR